MVHLEYTIRDEMGLHARPVSLLAKLASLYHDSKISLSCGEMVADATHLTAVMDMQIKQGDKISLIIEGGPEQVIADAILRFFMAENL